VLKTGKAVIQHLSEMTLFLNYCIFSGSAEMCAKYYENPTMLSRVIAKNVGDVFF